MISAIAHGRTKSGERLSRQEIASFISLLMVAGGETTDRALASFWWILLQHPEVLAAVRADPSLLDAGLLGVHAPRRRDRVRGSRADPGRRVVRAHHPRR